MSGIDSFTKLLLHFDGSDGSTTFVDSSFSGRAITTVGNAQIDTAQYKFGGASGLFDGNGDYLTVPDSDDWYFGTGDFTIDVWIRVADFSTYRTICAQRVDDNNYWVFYLGSNLITFAQVVSSSVNINVQLNYSFSVNTWYHIALIRTGNTWRAFVNGTQVGADVSESDSVSNFAASLQVGAALITGYLHYFNGWMDELRISKGIARWTSNFTVPTRPYSRNQAAFLLNMV